MAPVKRTIIDMRRLAQLQAGRCISDTYIDARTPLWWECKMGHRWIAKPNSIQQGRWCPYCAGRRRLTIEDMHTTAARSGGKCLSRRYVNNATKLMWQCDCGHKWRATPGNVRAGKWCPKCAGHIKLTMKEMYSIAKAKGGKCLSSQYTNNETNLKWKCAKSHTWLATPASLRSGSWCRVCAGLAKPTLSYLRRVAKSRGGVCLSSEYRNAKTKMLWQCSHAHQWKAVWDKIRSGQWCPTCATGLGERICRAFFEQLLRHPFPKTRPKWLINIAGNQMELDGYSKELKIAFEHQGEQHYSIRSLYSVSSESLARRKKDDRRKRTLCSRHGVTLIIVPEIPGRIRIEDVESYIKKELARLGVRIPAAVTSKEINLRKAYSTSGTQATYMDLCKIAKDQGGRCRSDHYIGDNVKLEWECTAGHRWRAIPSSIKQGTWCPYCAGTSLGTLEDLQNIAETRGGKCLARSYTNSVTLVLWSCHNGHRWKARPTQVKCGSWCPYCAGRHKPIKTLVELAKARGGKCLSKMYLGAKTKHSWQCSHGHKWEATFDSVRRGSWCPYCAGRKRSIVDMEALATQHSGKCISRSFKGMSVKLRWQCAKGHTWSAIPSSIRAGRWCPKCRSSKLTIEQMREVASLNEGTCLSKHYVNANTKLRWKCVNGHKWLAAPKDVKAGRWCPVCAQKKREGAKIVCP
jgi:hypothetical protein